MTTIGFIGLGHMGNPMVKNLLKQGHSVNVFDISQEAISKAKEAGANPTNTLKELALNSEVIFTMLQTGEQVYQVCMGKEGLFNFFEANKLYIDSSSIDVATSRQIHEIAKQKNIAMVDAPVSGGVAGAESGNLTFMVGGEEKDFLQAKRFLDCLGQKIIHAGPGGNGQAAKICNNMILGISMIAVSEGFVLAKKLGLDPKKFFEIAANASGQCWSMTKYCPMPNVLENVPSNRNFEPGFAAAMMLKDLKLSQIAAQQSNVATPLGAEATALYSLFVNNGNSNVDFSGIIKLISGEDL